jgi:iron(III) transport system substrate-binding protein
MGGVDMRKLNLYPLLILLAMLLVVLAIFSCGNGKAPAAKREVNLYTSIPPKIIDNIKLEFEKEKPGIELEVYRDGTVRIMERILAEAKTGEAGADVVWLADFSAAEELKEKGLLQKYISPEAKNIIPIFLDTEGYYTGSRLLNVVIAYNKQFVKEKPQSYHELQDLKWTGKVGIADPEVSGASYYTVSTLLQNKDFGWEYFLRIYQNKCEIVNDNTFLAEKIASGELYIGLIIDFTIRELWSGPSSPPVDYTFAEDGIVAIASPIAIARDCKETEASRTFIDWVLSGRGQAFLARNMGIAPVRMDVQIPEGMIPLQQLKIIPSNAREIYENKERNIEIFKAIFSGKSIEEIKMRMPGD